ncbi:MAG: malto-oligosyltrehalose trehalohydrolase [Bryobacteraceae bacterium]
MQSNEPTLGAIWLGRERALFRVWAPAAGRVDLHIVEPAGRLVEMTRQPSGYHEAFVEPIRPGALYFYRLNGRDDRPDPASRFQPRGVHGPSALIDPGFPWEDSAWTGIPLESYVFYEVHVGAFTPEGTFDAVIPHIDPLLDLGITAIEIMPVAQFPGTRNWGYDGVYPFSVQDSYGGPAALKRLVNACHKQGMAVVLDVVYNHLGPEGNYLSQFGPYFTDRHRTPWGEAINFDGPGSEAVRNYFVENALHWTRDYHFDALRLDAVHAIIDDSPCHILQEIGDRVHEYAASSGRRIHVIAESDLNEARVIEDKSAGGYGLDAQWSDDFHHSLHVALTGEGAGYYKDFVSGMPIEKAYREGFVYSGQFSGHRGRKHGTSSAHLPASRFVVCSQNHDQVGNRALGERLSQLVDFESLKLAAGAVLLSPFLPLLFMGEEYGETAPFLYFVSHGDPDLVEAVRRGRSEEFPEFATLAEALDPQSESTFERSRLDHSLASRGGHAVLRDYYRTLLGLRRTLPPLALLSKEQMTVASDAGRRAILLRRRDGEDECLILLAFSQSVETLEFDLPRGRWNKLIDSASAAWNGPGAPAPESIASDGRVSLALNPRSCLLFRKEFEGISA